MALQDDGKPLPLHLVWQRMMDDRARNERIASDVADAVREGRVAIVLSDRKEHLKILSERLAAEIPDEDAGLVTLEASPVAPETRNCACGFFHRGSNETSGLPVRNQLAARGRLRSSASRHSFSGHADFIRGTAHPVRRPAPPGFPWQRKRPDL